MLLGGDAGNTRDGGAHVRALADAGINIGLIATSEIGTSCVVAEAGVQAAGRAPDSDWEVTSVTPPEHRCRPD